MVNIKLKLFLPLIIGSLLFGGCVLNFDVDEDDIDMSVTMQKESDCQSITEYLVLAKKPYDKSFSARIGDATVLQHWVGMPDDEVDLEIQLTETTGNSFKTYKYFPSISMQWSEEAKFTITCDENAKKPVLLLDLDQFIAVVTTSAECRWFTDVDIYREVADSSDTNAPGLERLDSASFINDRYVFYWHEPMPLAPVLHIRMTDAVNKVHNFRFPIDLDLAQRFDFNISCNSETKEVFMVMEVADQTFEPTPYGTDGDSDGDVDSETDGDIDQDSVDSEDESQVDGDFDQTEQDQIEHDQTDQDQMEQDEIEQEQETGCGSEAPVNVWFKEAEDLFSKEDSNPSELANIIYTNEIDADGDADTDTVETEVTEEEAYLNPNVSGDGYVRLDAIETGGELVFKIDIAQAWEYNFLISYVGGSDGWGIVSLYLDDESEPIVLNSGETTFSLYRSTGSYNEWPFNSLTYRPVCLTAGTHDLRVKVVGSSTGGYTIGVDQITYRPQ